MKRIRTAAGRSALVTAALAVGLSGCSALSPSVITEPYPASDGTNANLPGSSVALRNFLVIGSAKGAPAELIGAVINDSATEVQVALLADAGQSTTTAPTVITVGAHSTVQVGPTQKTPLTIAALTVDPGATTTVVAQTAAGGKSELTVPVLRPEDEYTDVTPAPTTAAPTPTATATATKKPKKVAATDEPAATETTN